jgi:hypothetical protein
MPLGGEAIGGPSVPASPLPPLPPLLLLTVIDTGADNVVRPVLSVAMATNEYDPLAIDDQVAWYGAAVAVPTTAAPATKSIRAIVPFATVADAPSEMDVGLLNVVPWNGLVKDTVRVGTTGVPACETLTLWPAIVSAAVRGPVALAAIVAVSVLAPVPDAALSVAQLESLVAVQPQLE